MMLSTAEKQVKRYAPTPTPVVKFLLHTAPKVYYGFLDCTDMFQHFLWLSDKTSAVGLQVSIILLMD